MGKKPVRILTETRADQRLIEGIFREEVLRGTITVESGLSSGGILMEARHSLLEEPDRPLAGVVNTATEDPITIEVQIAGPFRRMLSGATWAHWQFALAIPNIEAWIRADPRIKAALDEDEARLGKQPYARVAARFLELVAEEPFDREAVACDNGEFRKLDEFIRLHAAAPASATAE